MNLKIETFISFFLFLSSAFVFPSFLMILTGKKHGQVKLERLQKVLMWVFGLFTSNQLFVRGS